MKSPLILFFLSILYLPVSAQSLTVNTGNSPYTISSNVTYTSVTVTGGGNLIVNSGVTLTITGTTGPLLTISSNGTILDNNGTIVVGNAGNSAANTVVTMTQGSILNMSTGSQLTVNGSFNAANSAALNIDGAIQVNGNFTSNNTSAINGSGSLNTTGSLVTNNTSTVFGSAGSCATGPCSGGSLCGFTVSISADQTVCSGNTAAVLTSTTTAGSPVYRWQSSATGAATSFTNATGTNNNATYSPGVLAATRWYRLQVTSAGCTQYGNTIKVTVNPIPVIVTQPANQAACVGSSATFSVTATGTGLTYQWRKNGINISGANSSSYTTPAVGTIDNGATYSVVITSSGCTVTSNNATLTVNSPPTMIVNPTDQAVCQGNAAFFFSLAWGSGTTYQWRKNGVNIPGATSFFYAIGTTSTADAGTYDVVATRNGCSVTSASATLTINSAPVITVQPANQGACVGGTATFNVTVTSGTTLTYQWRKNGTNIAGATASSYTTPATVLADNGALFSVVITNSCGNVTSSNATLSVSTPATITSQPANQNVCLSASASFSVVATGTGLTYQWRKNGSNISGATSTTYSIPSNLSADAGNYDVLISLSGCSVASNVATLTITTTNQWNGITNTDWFNGSNWSCGIVPTSNLDVLIPSGLINYPTVNATANAKNITISALASLTMTNGSTIQVYGDFSNNGSFTANTSNFNFNATAAQIIGGSSTTTFSSININNSVGVSLARDANLTNRITLGSNAKFTTTGYEFILVSNAGTTGSIGPIPASASFTGNIRMQRYIPPSGRYWYHMSSPVSTGTVAQWQTGAPTGGFYVTGPFTGASNPGNGVVKTGVSAYSWNASLASWDRFPVNANTEVIEPRAGYRVFIRDGNAAYNGGNTTTKTFSLLGPPNTGDQTFTLPYSPTGGKPAGGWNLIGNPYPSNINGNLNNSAWTTKTNLDGFATYMWDSDQRRYVSCNGGLGACVIPSCQAFWVKVNPGGGTLTATENVKTSGLMSLYKKTATAPQYIPVVLTNTQYGEKDITYLRFEDDATGNFDNEYDAYKLDVLSTGTSSSYVLLSSMMNSTELSINARTTPVSSDTIHLNIGGYDGTHTLDFSDRTNLSDEYHMLLIDKYSNAVVDLDLNSVYTFSIQTSISATAGKRFDIVFTYIPLNVTSTTPAASAKALNIYPNPATSGYFIINLNENKEEVNVSICNMIGAQVFEKNYAANDNIKVEINKSLPSGTYVVTVKTGEEISRSKLVVE